MDNPYSSPRGLIATPTGSQAPLTWKQILFSFDGRIPRRTFWGVSILVGVIAQLLAFAAETGLGETAAAMVALVLLIPLFWISLAVTVKRWHDRDKSWAWIFLPLIPIVGAIWAFVECGCLRGTEGPNQYGEDPT